MKHPSRTNPPATPLLPTAVALAVLVLACTQARAQAQERQVSTLQVAAASVPGMVAAPGTSTLAQFDEQILKDRGLDPSIGYYFRRAPRFTPGETVVQVTVNGNVLGRKSATFDDVGQLCFTPAFVRSIGLRPITQADGSPAAPAIPGECIRYTDFSPRTVVTLDPSTSAVDIVTPPEFVTQERRTLNTEQGGIGALLNYRLLTLENRVDGAARSSFRQFESTVGFNADDWIVRSQQTYSDSNGRGTFRLQSMYGQRNFAEHQQTLQVGRTWTQSPLFSGVPLEGVQWFPETALTQAGHFAVTGVASTRARVEIRQNGVLIHSTVVPPGAFSLNDFPLPNTQSDLQVKVIEDNGAEKISVVPASTLMLGVDATVPPGLSVAAGRLWDATYADSLRQSPLLTASQGWNYGGRVSGVAGALVSSNYASVGASVSARPWENLHSVYAQLLMARDSENDNSGALGSASTTLFSTDRVSVGVSGNLRSRGYRSVQEARSFWQRTGLDYGYRTQLGTDTRWDAGAWGSLYASLTRQTYFSGDPGYIYNLGWNGSWRNVNLFVGLSHSTARNSFDPLNPGLSLAGNNYAYVNLSIPLGGEATSTSYARRSYGVTRMGTGVDQRLNDTVAYRASVDTVAGQSDTTSSNLTAYLLPRYSSLTLGVGQGSGYSNLYGEASGGVVLHSEGVAFSPYPVRDTFGVLRLSDPEATDGSGGVSGVRVETPQGPVWTGVNGLAAIPTMLPYRETRVEVATSTLPDDVDVSDALQVAQLGRGAVTSLKMGATRVRRVMLTVTLPDGAALPYGTPILRGGDEFFTAAAEGGRVMLSNLQPGATYAAQLPGGRLCTLKNVEVSPKQDGEYYERGTARCD